jgi:phage gpG-like protein
MASSEKFVDLNSDALVAALAQFADRAEDLTEPMSIIAESLVTAVHDKFEQSGPGWPDLSEYTKKRRRGSEYQILVDTGILSGSIASEHGADFAQVGTSVEYAKYHVSAEPRTKIPLRDFFDLDEGVYEDAADVILEHLAG